MQDYLKRQLWITASCYLGQVLVGYGMGWTAPIIPKLQDPEQSPLPIQISETETSLIGSILYVGTIAGPYLSGYLCNVVGRKPCFYLGGFLTLLAFLLLATANNLAMIYIGRVIIGLGTGIIFIVNLVYIGEIAAESKIVYGSTEFMHHRQRTEIISKKMLANFGGNRICCLLIAVVFNFTAPLYEKELLSSNVRGILLTGTAIFSTFGTLLVYAIGPYVAYSVVSYVAVGITAMYILGIIFIPESPTYLLLKDRKNEVKEVMNMLRRSDECEDVELTKIVNQKRNALEEWKEILTVKSNRKALFITLTLGLLQQGSGIIALVFFATTIFELAGSSIEPHIATIIIGVTQIFASTLTPFFVERMGRKILLLFSTAVCCLSLATLGVYFYLDFINHSSVSSIQWLPLVTLIVFFLGYDFGFGIIPGTLIGEMFHSKVRSTGSTVSVTLSWLFGFGFTTLFGYMVSELGSHVTFWIFSGMCALAFLFTMVFVPETKGKTLDEIQFMLNK